MIAFVTALLGGVALAAATASLAQAQDFYAGKTITVVTSTGAGGGYDLAARAIARHMPKHVAGTPTMIVQNMPGGGHMIATNHMYNVAPKDGTAIAIVHQIVPSHQVLDGTNARYDAAKFNWIGALSDRNAVMTVWHTSSVKTIADVMEREVTAGATGDASVANTYPSVMNKVLGTKFKIVRGYKSSSEINIALERGEIESRGGGLQGLMSQHADWVRDGKVRFIVQIGSKRDATLPDVPLWTEVAKTDEQRQVLQLISAPILLGWPFLAPPDVPADRLAILRKAFMAATRDKTFIDEAAKQNIGTGSIDHEEVMRIVRDTITAPPDIIAKAKAAM